MGFNAKGFFLSVIKKKWNWFSVYKQITLPVLLFTSLKLNFIIHFHISKKVKRGSDFSLRLKVKKSSPNILIGFWKEEKLTRDYFQINKTIHIFSDANI